VSHLRVQCALGCGTDVDPASKGVYQYVEGWAKNREHGTNALALRVPRSKWACRPCIDRRTQGIPDGQTGAFD
jgi:hypothetical protein